MQYFLINPAISSEDHHNMIPGPVHKIVAASFVQVQTRILQDIGYIAFPAVNDN
jgi:hypothetical protein